MAPYGMLFGMDEANTWLDKHPTVTVVLADRPPAGADWRSQEGWGWIFKAWFRSWRQSHRAMEEMRAEGWQPKFWGRKLRVSVADGHEGQRLADFVLTRWPNAKIQLRND